MLEKLKFINKNQVIMIVVALVLVAVGYLNFASSSNDTQTASTNEMQLAGIGDAKLVSSSNVVEENENDNSEITETNATNINNVTFDNSTLEEDNVEKVKETVTKNEIINTTVETASKEADEYFTTSRLNRQNMYSQMIETYQKILESDQISADQKTIAQTEIKNINDIKNKIMICENLIKVKDIEDVIVFVNEPSVSVVVKIKELKQEQIAQIQNIITREIQVDIGNIHISNKY